MSTSTAQSQPTRFQARTISYVIKRFWGDSDPARRFLVADEVGLGKTMIAREVLAEALRRRPNESLDIVYLCSSQPVASQNLDRLKVQGRSGTTKATRLTLLAIEPPAAVGNIRYFALTPDTSFKVTGRSGTVLERALIFLSLRSIFRSLGFKAIMQQVSEPSWTNAVVKAKPKPKNPIVRAFRDAVLDDLQLQTDTRDTAKLALIIGEDPAAMKKFKKDRDDLVGRFRRLLALKSAEGLASNGLVIIDEFQRFSSLLDTTKIDKDFGVRLADRLLSPDVVERRVLLLSATPYRLPGGNLGHDEKPYADLVALVSFLAEDKTAAKLSDALDRYGRSLRAAVPDAAEVTASRDEAGAILRKVMCRTERTASAANAMVREEVRLIPSNARDLAGAIAARNIARRLKVHDPVEYWKSAPFFLEFMREYRFKDAVMEASNEADRRFAGRLAKQGNLLLDRQAVKCLEPIVSPSPRMRDLIDDALPEGAERLLWLPPSLPYTIPGGQFSKTTPDLKRLVFTEWRLAPDAISAMTSYEIERRLAASLRALHGRRHRESAGGASQRHREFGKLGNMLRLIKAEKKRAKLPRSGRARKTETDPGLAMIPLALMLAGPVMAHWGDSLPHVAQAGHAVEARTVLDHAASSIRNALKTLPVGTGRVDSRWYWAAPLLLERDLIVKAWLNGGDPFLASAEPGEFDLHRIRDAIETVIAEPKLLGKRPKNLVSILAKLAVGSPANCAFRSLSRTAAGLVDESELMRCAFHVARGFQSLFNQGEAAAAVQLEHPGRKRVFWDQVLDYCINGNLAALLDEHMHFEAEGLAMLDGTSSKKVEKAARNIHGALTLRRASIDARGLTRRRAAASGVSGDAVRMRCRHGARFAEVKEADGSVSRLDAVRAAFNSPFRPFILASTAVGQEGLDFHPWCHAVVHWNLPKSPVELEQREGRVHRYKGHAVRLNVANAIGLGGLAPWNEKSDPWKRLFDQAGKIDTDNELSPFWLFEVGENPTRIRRIVPALQFSREEETWPALRARLGTYRLAMGLPRADDLLDALQKNGTTPEQAAAWRIDLRPPGSHPRPDSI